MRFSARRAGRMRAVARWCKTRRSGVLSRSPPAASSWFRGHGVFVIAPAPPAAAHLVRPATDNLDPTDGFATVNFRHAGVTAADPEMSRDGATERVVVDTRRGLTSPCARGRDPSRTRQRAPQLPD